MNDQAINKYYTTQRTSERRVICFKMKQLKRVKIKLKSRSNTKRMKTIKM